MTKMQKSLSFSQGGESGQNPGRCRTSEGARAYISYLYLSAMNSPIAW